MNPYEVLGVEPDATDEEIKQAYRSKAQASHPDREGGDEERFKRVGAAFTLLSDPEKRARFDETGTTDQEVSLEEEADNVLDNLFRAALDVEGDMLAWCREKLDADTLQIQRNRAAAEAMHARLQVRRSLIKVREGKNRLHELIDLKLASIARDLVTFDRLAQLGVIVSARLDFYESGEAKPRPYGPSRFRWGLDNGMLPFNVDLDRG